jgi:VWFA-related protein
MVVVSQGLNAQQAKTTLGDVLEVRVTNVDIVATDSKGNPVAGLTPADFEVYEDGKLQEITNFYEVSAPAQTGAAQATGPARSIAASRPVAGPASVRKFIFYVDNGTLSLKNRSEIFSGIRQFVSTNMGPGDQAMIVNWSGSLHVRLPWTGDWASIDSTLTALAGELGTAGQIQAEKQRTIRLLRQLEAASQDPTAMVTYEMVESAVRSYAESVLHDIGQSVNALNKLLASLSGVEGRKILIMATESLPTQAGAEVLQAFENIRARARVAPAPTTSTPQGGAPPVGTTLSVGSKRATPMSGLSKYNVSPLIEALARTANATRVTVYAINPKGTDNNNSGTVELTDPSELNIDFSESAQAFDGVSLLAGQTGGKAMIGQPAAMALAQLSRDLDSYYSLGYRTRPGTSPDRKIEVRAKRAGVTVRYRNSVYYRSLQTEMADRVIANHLQSEVSNELGVTLQVNPVTANGTQKLLPVLVVIPADGLTLLPDGDGNMSGGFSVFTSTGNRDGAASGVNIQSQTIHWPPAQATQMKGRRIAFVVQVPMDRNPKQISVGVIDHVSQIQGFATMNVAAN